MKPSAISEFMKKNASKGGKARWRKINKRLRSAAMKALAGKRWEKSSNEEAQDKPEGSPKRTPARIEGVAQSAATEKADQETRSGGK